MRKKSLLGVLLLVCGVASFKTQAQDTVEVYPPVVVSKYQILQESDYLSYATLKHAINTPDQDSNVVLLQSELNGFINSYRSFDPPLQHRRSGNERLLAFPSLVIPAIGITYGVVALHDSAPKDLNLSTKNEIREHHPYFVTHVDNYLQWSPAAAVIGLNIAGVHGKHSFGDEIGIYGLSTLIMVGSVVSLKHITHEERPDHSSFTSFPSGHTATAFAAAEWLRTEYWQRSPWIGIAGYTVAAATGALRVYNNRHWVSDVIAGAAIGFLSTHIAYAINPWIKQRIFHENSPKVR
jgi:hypothetical protein